MLKAYDKDDTVIDVDALYFDGYGFGDRALEGAVFKITATPDLTVTCLTPLPAHYDKTKIEADGLAYAKTHDVFSTTPELDNDDGFIDIPTPQPQSGPRQVGMMTGDAFLKMLKGL